MNYHKFAIPKPTAITATIGDDSGYTLRKHKTKADITGILLRSKKSVDYTPMMQSDVEEEDDAPPRKQNKIRPHPNGPSPMVLQAHETINKNNKSKKFHTKPVTAKPSRKPPLNTDEAENDQNTTNAKTEPVETDNTEDAETEPVGTESKEKIIRTFVTKTIGIRKHKKERKAKCRICGDSFENVKELNKHHRIDHDIQFCPECGKGFNMQTSLDKHKYYHWELKFVCEHCGQGFPFVSRLKQHKITHRTIATLPCMYKNCGPTCKNLGDLNRHIGQHDGVWFTCDFCTYCNKDKQNMNSHMKTHVEGNELYGCQHCGKHFRFSMQYRRVVVHSLRWLILTRLPSTKLADWLSCSTLLYC